MVILLITINNIIKINIKHIIYKKKEKIIKKINKIKNPKGPTKKGKNTKK